MKNFIIIAFLLLSTIGFAQEQKSILAQEQKQDTTITITTAERLIDKYSEKGITAFNNAVDKIAPTAVEGFEIVVKLQIAKGIANLLPLIGFIIFFSLLYKEYFRIETILEKIRDPDNSYKNDSFNRNYGPFGADKNITLILAVNLAGTIILFVMGLVCISYAIEYLLAPEWFAVKEIMGLFK